MMYADGTDLGAEREGLNTVGDGIEVSFHYLESERTNVGAPMTSGFGPRLELLYGEPGPETSRPALVLETNYVPRQSESFEPEVQGLAARYSAWDGVDVTAKHYNYPVLGFKNSTDRDLMYVSFSGPVDAFKEFVEDVKASGYGTPDDVHVSASALDWLAHPVQTYRARDEVASYMDDIAQEHRVEESVERDGNRIIRRSDITFE